MTTDTAISAVYDKVYRVGGDEFIALVDQTDPTLLDSLADEEMYHIKKRIHSENGRIPIQAAVGN